MEAIDKVRIDTNELDKDIEQLQTLLGELHAAEKNMIEQITQLNTMWTGQANIQFNQQFAIDCGKFENLRKAILEYKKKLGKAKVEYNKCDAKVYDTINIIKV